MDIKAEKIYKAYSGDAVLNDVSFSLEKGQKIGLVGYNGTGKTTLLKILAGLIKPDSGKVTVKRGAVIGYVPQDTGIISDETIRDYVRRVSGMAALEERMGKSSEAVIEYERRDGYSFYHRLDITLAGFGLANISSNRPINSLSSGQKSKVFMTAVLLSSPDILLLDEPTNNLDLPALIWLEDFLMKSNAACIIVSHDRLFLNQIVRKIFEIDWHSRTLNVTNGRYSDYLIRKEKELARRWQKYEVQQKEIKRLASQAREKKQEAISGSRFVGTDNDKYVRGFKRDRAAKSGKRAKAIEKRIEQMEIVEKPIERNIFRIYLQPIKPGGTRDIVIVDVVAGYSDDFKIGPISIAIPYGSRVAILGLNGVGKTTFLKIISGEISVFKGKVNWGSSLVIGNFMQEHDNLPREENIKNFLMGRANISVQDVYALIAKFGFKATEIDKKISNLSPGGRARLLFALFSALSVNVLILDEPTNHLDLEALEALDEVVVHYEGTIVLVSHDRYFLQKFHPTDIYILSDGKLLRMESFEKYLTNAEQQAKRLISMI